MRRAGVGLVVALVGCDPTAGLSDSADAALPQIKRYIDGPGQQLTAGPWSRVVVDLDADTLYHVGARRLDDEQPTFHLFGADARDGCAVTPNAGTWLMGKSSPAPFRLLPFVETMDERGRGRLRFTTLDCQVQDLVLEDAGRPYPRVFDHGYLVPTGQGYTFADPWSGTQREIAGKMQDTLVWSDAVLFWADDQLKSFSDQFEPGREWGHGVTAVMSLGQGWLAEDEDGLHRVELDHDSLEISAKNVLPDTCRLQASSQFGFDSKSIYVMASQPCDNPRPTLLAFDLFELEQQAALELPFEADSRHMRPVVFNTLDGEEPQPSVVFYLTEVDADGFGTLWAWQAGTEAPTRIGEHAALDTAYVGPPDSEWAGGAEVNYRRAGEYLVYDSVHFNWDGTTVPLANDVLRYPGNGNMLVNFDGVAGDLPLFSSLSYAVLDEGVPAGFSDAVSFVGERYHARVDHFDGVAGRAILGEEAKLSADSWQVVGSDVPPDQLRFAWFMPALFFIENWDAKKNSGSLVAYNYELDARATIAEGVSSFDLTSYPWDGVVYSVPRGKQQGIWFAKAK